MEWWILLRQKHSLRRKLWRAGWRTGCWNGGWEMVASLMLDGGEVQDQGAGQGEPAFARICVAARSGETVRTVEP